MTVRFRGAVRCDAVRHGLGSAGGIATANDAVVRKANRASFKFVAAISLPLAQRSRFLLHQLAQFRRTSCFIANVCAYASRSDRHRLP